MNIFKKRTSVDDSLFDKDGNVILTKDTAYVMDFILLLMINGVIDVIKIQLELYRSGIHITYRDLNKIIDYLVKEGFISKSELSNE